MRPDQVFVTLIVSAAGALVVTIIVSILELSAAQ